MVETNEFGQIVGAKVANWQPAKRPSKESLYGHYCILEVMDIDKHAHKLFEALKIDNNGESWTYLPHGPFDDVEDFREWLKANTKDPETLLYAILDIKSGEPIGMAAYLRICPEHGSIEVARVHFSALLKNRPAATEAMYLIMRNVFENLGYRRYEWKCHSLNQASKNAAERLGFTFEGIFRQCNVFKGRNRDTAWFSIIDSEWPRIKAKLEKWLNPNNFDHNGHQKLSLREMN
jgi:RimJ/RimL family protein N-acetyltransferase